ncbi:TPA: TraR/DksA family transcriptional regulator [Vibrio harveyi]|uniref:TraR/DksA family transcriptional regulator n=1 Tax=Vibrio harveyi TaxID=669 RepID=UPI000682BB49|nr:TraR/DksA family transcriptional regulator [Vibrio harveyi]HDZ3731975.1 TraR/DksA family transcriptional regulator [Vibrio harveyi]HDZ3734286.1 TraR/DksA family transcriptional regulator [Vibrio harveyi]
MTDVFDKAQELEQTFREKAISHQLSRPQEKPDEDEDGNRYCLSCGGLIPPERIQAYPAAVRCVSCQSLKEPKYGMA